MFETFYNRARSCGNILLESCRILLFFLCIAYLMVEFATFYLLLTADAPARSSVIMKELFMICMLLACSFGAFFSHKTTLQVFFTLMLIYACSLSFLLVASIKANPIDRITRDYEKDMKVHAPNYQWSKNSSTSAQKEATKAWNSTPLCCGLNGPEDWSKPEFQRPPTFARYLPPSCCIRGIKEQRLCSLDKDAIFQIGCLESLKVISNIATVTISCLLALYFLLSLLAAILVYFLPEGISEQGKDISAWMKMFASTSNKRKNPINN